MAAKDEIVRAAGALIGAQGFGAVSVAEIATACGMTKQAVLYHYRTKDAIKDAVVDYLIQHANKSLLQLLSTITGDPAERIEQALSQLYSLFAAEPWAASVILRFLIDGDSDAVQRLSEGTLPWARYTAEEIERGARDRHFRKLPDPHSTLEQIGMLVLANFATLSQKGWTDESPKRARQRKLEALLRVIRTLLFED